MKGDITIKILEVLGKSALDTVELFDVFLSAGYGASAGRFQYVAAQKGRAHARADAEKQRHQRYYALLYKLKKQGLINQDKKRAGFFVRTKTGAKKLLALKANLTESLPTPRRYQQEKNGHRLLIVTFDVPEHSRRKRDWLRGALRTFGMQMIQKSVWAGKIKLPEKFLEDLRRYSIHDYVEIFEISKTGSLKQIG